MKKFLSIATAVLSVAACTSGHDGWTLKGDIEGGAGKTVYIEGSTIGNWYLIDSVAIGEDDTFDYIAAKADSLPTIYRIRLADKYIYFPAQGTQTLTLKANAKSFDRGFDVAGSPLAVEFTTVDRLINKYIDSLGTEAARQDKNLKTELMLMVNKDTTCLASYYIVGKFIDKRPLLNLSDRADLRILGNAANNYKRLYPNDPRAKTLSKDTWPHDVHCPPRDAPWKHRWHPSRTSPLPDTTSTEHCATSTTTVAKASPYSTSCDTTTKTRRPTPWHSTKSTPNTKTPD